MVEISQQLLDDLALATGKIIKSYTLHPINEELWDVDADSGDNNIDFDAIAAGRLAIITAISALDVDNSPSLVQLGPVSGGNLLKHKSKTSPTANESVVFAGQLILAEGEFIRAHFEGVTANDDLYAFVNGYWITI